MQQGKIGLNCKNFVAEAEFVERALYTLKATITESSGPELIYQ
jgi:hypothetical protein